MKAKVTPKRKAPVQRKRPAPALAFNGHLLISVFGPPKTRRALVEMSVTAATALFEEPLSSTLAPTRVIDATMAELEALAKREPGLDNSALAASAVAIAYELDSPFNSATSKSMCAAQLRETMKRLAELAPEQTKDRVDELAARRETRRKPATARRKAAKA